MAYREVPRMEIQEVIRKGVAACGDDRIPPFEARALTGGNFEGDIDGLAGSAEYFGQPLGRQSCGLMSGWNSHIANMSVLARPRNDQYLSKLHRSDNSRPDPDASPIGKPVSIDRGARGRWIGCGHLATALSTGAGRSSLEKPNATTQAWPPIKPVVQAAACTDVGQAFFFRLRE